MTTVRERVSQTNETFVEGLNSGDVEKAISVYAEDAVLAPAPALTNGVPTLIKGISEIRKFWAGLLTNGLHDVQLFTDRVEERGGQSWDIGEFSLMVGENGVTGFYVVVARSSGWAVDSFGPDA